jgi:carbonic anhydrase
MNKVVRGIADFVRSKRPGMRATFQRLAHGQEPVALLVACSDSRIVSSLLLGTDPGDLFEVRTVGNLVAPADPGGKASAGERSSSTAAGSRSRRRIFMSGALPRSASSAWTSR